MNVNTIGYNVINTLAVVQKPTSGSQNMNVMIIAVAVVIILVVAATIFGNKK